MYGKRPRRGDLSTATSRPGVVIRCVSITDDLFHRYWRKIRKANKFHGGFFLPEVGRLYLVRANVVGPNGVPSQLERGIALNHCPSGLPFLNPALSLNGGVTVELYFPYTWFNFVRDRP
jgi:hypothetical protein